MTISSWIESATAILKDSGIDSARLDAELLLAHTIRRPRTYLHAHGSDEIEPQHLDVVDARLELRRNRTPLAYIVGHKEFYGRRFKTTPSALIPRPESEAIIEILTELVPKTLLNSPYQVTLVDVGTGTGCLGITAKLEYPVLDVTLVDIDVHTLNLANENAELLSADVHFIKNDLLKGFITKIDYIIANLPYVDSSWEVSPETESEPSGALYASDGGLALIYKLIDQSVSLLSANGHLILESDTRQHDDIIKYALAAGLKHLETRGLITVFSR